MKHIRREIKYRVGLVATIVLVGFLAACGGRGSETSVGNRGGNYLVRVTIPTGADANGDGITDEKSYLLQPNTMFAYKSDYQPSLINDGTLTAQCTTNRGTTVTTDEAGNVTGAEGVIGPGETQLLPAGGEFNVVCVPVEGPVATATPVAQKTPTLAPTSTPPLPTPPVTPNP